MRKRANNDDASTYIAYTDFGIHSKVCTLRSYHSLGFHPLEARTKTDLAHVWSGDTRQRSHAASTRHDTTKRRDLYSHLSEVLIRTLDPIHAAAILQSLMRVSEKSRTLQLARRRARAVNRSNA